MAKNTPTYVCNQCGAEAARWGGQCTACSAWNSIVEMRSGAGTGKRGRSTHWAGSVAGGARSLSEAGASERALRTTTGIGELDRVLGGGLVEGSVVLIGGDPGIGKSTLLLQALAIMAGKDVKTLYISGEESLAQIADRAGRLGLDRGSLRGAAETDVDAIAGVIAAERPSVVVVDSIQTISSTQNESAPGSVSQVRECAGALARLAKQNGFSLFLIGHVTKDGAIAGPRVLEHLVDAVLYFEGDGQSPYRLVRALKNRFGAANELGAFEMTERGLVSVDDPSAMFLSADRRAASGSCVFVLQDGPRALLIEIQCLMDETQTNNPRRLPVGVDGNRLAMLLAVLHKDGQQQVGSYDVFVNAVGGIKATETAADLPIMLAMVSSMRGKALPVNMACFGEVGLTGEVRPVQHSSERIREAARLGFKRILVPARNQPDKAVPGIEIVGVRTIAQALEQVMAWGV